MIALRCCTTSHHSYGFVTPAVNLWLSEIQGTCSCLGSLHAYVWRVFRMALHASQTMHKSVAIDAWMTVRWRPCKLQVSWPTAVVDICSRLEINAENLRQKTDSDFCSTYVEQNRHCIGSRPSDHYFRSVCLSVCLFVCFFVQSFSQPSLIRFPSN